MTTSEKLGWASLLVAILALLAALPFLFAEYIVVGMLLLFVALVLIAVFGYIRWGILDPPPFTLLSVEKTLTFEDKNAHKAHHVDIRRVKANHKGLGEYWYKGIGSDGSVQNIQIDHQQPHETQVQGGALEVCKQFPGNGLERGQVVRIRATMDFIDAFPSNPEFVTHLVSTKTKQVRINVEFHPQRPCTAVRVYLQYGGAQAQRLKDPWVSDDRTEIEFNLKKPKRGEEYRLEWNWGKS